MAEQDDYDDQDDTPNPRDLRNQLKEANARARAADELAAENKRLREDLVIRDAGISLNDRQRKALAATHDGTWDAESVKKTAVDLGFVTEPAEPARVDDPSLAAHDRIAAASAGTDAPPLDRDSEIDAQLAKATTQDEYMATYRASGRSIAL